MTTHIVNRNNKLKEVGIGDIVLDDLTNEVVAIIGIKVTGPLDEDKIQVSSPYLQGWRHAWEVSEIDN